VLKEWVPFSGDASVVKIILRGICGNDRPAHPDTVHASEKTGKKDECEVHSILAIDANKLHNPGAHFQTKISLDNIEIVETMCYLAPLSF
jgi:hypothetical protein